MNELVPNRNNYKKLLSYQKTDVIYRMTYYFCTNFLGRGDRTVDQMIHRPQRQTKYHRRLRRFSHIVKDRAKIAQCRQSQSFGTARRL